MTIKIVLYNEFAKKQSVFGMTSLILRNRLDPTRHRVQNDACSSLMSLAQSEPA